MDCISCGKAVPEIALRQKTKTCTSMCLKKEARHRRIQRYKEINGPPIGKNLSTSTVGALGELRVACDLLTRGYSVFRSVSPACSCDLAILVGKTLYRFEVTTANTTTNGKLNHPKKDPSKYDILAMVVRSGEIIYEPPLAELGLE